MSNSPKVGLTMITGGAWSGKTKFAQSLVQSEPKVTWIGTGSRLDPQLSQHIDSIAALRPPQWESIEAPIQLLAILESLPMASSPLVIDSANQWLGNLTALDSTKYSTTQLIDHMTAEFQSFLQFLNPHTANRKVIITTAEVSWGISPDSALAGVMRRAISTMNQELAQKAHSVFLVCSGIPHPLKSEN